MFQANNPYGQHITGNNSFGFEVGLVNTTGNTEDTTAYQSGISNLISCGVIAQPNMGLNSAYSLTVDAQHLLSVAQGIKHNALAATVWQEMAIMARQTGHITIGAYRQLPIGGSGSFVSVSLTRSPMLPYQGDAIYMGSRHPIHQPQTVSSAVYGYLTEVEFHNGIKLKEVTDKEQANLMISRSLPGAMSVMYSVTLPEGLTMGHVYEVIRHLQAGMLLPDGQPNPVIPQVKFTFHISTAADSNWTPSQVVRLIEDLVNPKLDKDRATEDLLILTEEQLLQLDLNTKIALRVAGENISYMLAKTSACICKLFDAAEAGMPMYTPINNGPVTVTLMEPSTAT